MTSFLVCGLADSRLACWPAAIVSNVTKLIINAVSYK
jgi:hypothetical protein